MKKSELQSSSFPNLLNIRFNKHLMIQSFVFYTYKENSRIRTEYKKGKNRDRQTLLSGSICDIWSKNYPFPCRRIYRSEEEERNVTTVRSKKKLRQLHKNEVEGRCGHEYEKHDILQQCHQEEIHVQLNRRLLRNRLFMVSVEISPNYLNNIYRTNLYRRWEKQTKIRCERDNNGEIPANR